MYEISYKKEEKMRKSLVLLLIVAFIVVGIFGSCTRKEAETTEEDTALVTATEATTEATIEATQASTPDALIEEFETTMNEYVNLVNNIANDPAAAATMLSQIETFLQQIADIQVRMATLGDDAFTQEQLEYIENLFEQYSATEEE